ncbi:MAG: tRNA (adenosine(37)-N6)-threonylcarbamoyltransferase complex dimerization subunit type 1 TsaB [Raineya sp.]
MAVILSIETATFVCSVALHREANLLGVYELHSEKSHSEQLNVLIEQICKQNNLLLKDISAVAVSQGPGSYTGLRIGTATAKGLCFALQKPLIAINTLEAMLGQINNCVEPDTLLCPMLDARRMEVYCLLANQQKEVLEPTQALIVESHSFEKHLSERKIVFFGNGATKCKEVLKHKNSFFCENIHPSARSMGQIAWQKFQKNEFESLIYFEPYYLKDFVGKENTSGLK